MPHCLILVLARSTGFCDWMPMTLQDKLAAGRFVPTAEAPPPVAADRNDLLAKAAPLKGLADAVNITDGAGARAHLGSVAAPAVLVRGGQRPSPRVPRP